MAITAQTLFHSCTIFNYILALNPPPQCAESPLFKAPGTHNYLPLLVQIYLERKNFYTSFLSRCSFFILTWAIALWCWRTMYSVKTLQSKCRRILTGCLKRDWVLSYESFVDVNVFCFKSYERANNGSLQRKIVAMTFFLTRSLQSPHVFFLNLTQF